MWGLLASYPSSALTGTKPGSETACVRRRHGLLRSFRRRVEAHSTDGLLGSCSWLFSESAINSEGLPRSAAELPTLSCPDVLRSKKLRCQGLGRGNRIPCNLGRSCRFKK